MIGLCFSESECIFFEFFFFFQILIIEIFRREQI